MLSELDIVRAKMDIMSKLMNRDEQAGSQSTKDMQLLDVSVGIDSNWIDKGSAVDPRISNSSGLDHPKNTCSDKLQ